MRVHGAGPSVATEMDVRMMDPDDLIELFAFLYFFALGLLATGAV